jgi:hypothetical protein
MSNNRKRKDGAIPHTNAMFRVPATHHEKAWDPVMHFGSFQLSALGSTWQHTTEMLNFRSLKSQTATLEFATRMDAHTSNEKGDSWKRFVSTTQHENHETISPGTEPLEQICAASAVAYLNWFVP